MKIPTYILFLFISIIIGNTSCTTKQKTTLKTGWYFVIDATVEGSAERQMERGEQIYYLNTQPILTVAHFKDAYLYTGIDITGMRMELNDEGLKLWSDATGKWVSKYIAFIYDDKLIGVQRIATQDSVGETIIYNKAFTEAELIVMIDGLGFGKEGE